MRNEHDAQVQDVQVRSIARQLARELSEEEISAVSGGNSTWSGTNGPHTDDADIPR